ncbi:MAG: Thymidine kinase [Microgenomates group bacterium GW2011_GWB1_40_9]|nr:MAG: Thymidine kinase [Microgenomates group bacterium GW2011_GWB1_40_9]
MNKRFSKGKLTVIAGPMFSGKTGKLVALIEVFTKMGYKVLTVKPAIDSRYGAKKEIHSHDHKKSNALVIGKESVEEILQKILATGARKVIVDEVQFFDKDVIITVIMKLKKLGYHVIAAGLLYDYKRQPFGATPDLMGLADEHLELFAVCQRCGSLARHTERQRGGKSLVVVGASDSYIAACEKCHRVLK